MGFWVFCWCFTWNNSIGNYGFLCCLSMLPFLLIRFILFYALLCGLMFHVKHLIFIYSFWFDNIYYYFKIMLFGLRLLWSILLTAFIFVSISWTTSINCLYNLLSFCFSLIVLCFTWNIYNNVQQSIFVILVLGSG